jgi:hypothetical protein
VYQHRRAPLPVSLIYRSDWTDSFAKQVQRSTTTGYAKLLRSTNPGYIAAEEILGHMSSSNETLIEARLVQGTPLIDDLTDWKYLVWKLEADTRAAEESFGIKDLHVVRGLQELSTTDMEWLGRVPHDALIELRTTGAIHEIREVLGTGVQTLIDVTPENFHRTRDQVFDNIHAAFDRHRQAVRDLTNRKWRFAGSGIGTWLVVGSIEVTAAITGVPVWGVTTWAANQLLDVPKLKDIPKSIKGIIAESTQLKQSPVALLFNAARAAS